MTDDRIFRVGSLFSGIEGFGVGFTLAGANLRWVCEVDKWANRVLATRFPGVPNIGDITKANPSTLEDVDCITFGFPCQDLSVAGHREGLQGTRSGLFWEALRVIASKRPRWIVAENVPGLLSSNQGMDFGVVLWALAALGYGVAYAELDAQHHGVPQRRRRIFIVGCLGDASRAGAVLSHASGGYRNPSASKGTGSDASPGLGAGPTRPLYYTHDYSHERIYDGGGGVVPAVTVGKRETFKLQPTAGERTSSRKGAGSAYGEPVGVTLAGGKPVTNPLRAGRAIADVEGDPGNIIFGTLRSNHRNNSHPGSDPLIWDTINTRTGKGPDSDGRGIVAAPVAKTLGSHHRRNAPDDNIIFNAKQDPVNGALSGAVGSQPQQGILTARGHSPGAAHLRPEERVGADTFLGARPDASGATSAPLDAPGDGALTGLPRWLELPMWQAATEPWRLHLDRIAVAAHRREESRQDSHDTGWRGMEGGSGAVAGGRGGASEGLDDGNRVGGTTGSCDCPDTPRYRCTGNAVPVPVAYRIAKRIREVDA